MNYIGLLPHKNPLPYLVLLAQFSVFSHVCLADYSAHQLAEPSSNYSPRVTSRIGDINGDGKPDFATADFLQHGTVAIYSGANWSLVSTLEGVNSYDNFGTAISEVGDINGDGKADFIVGSPRRYTTCSLSEPSPANQFRGIAQVFSGAAVFSGTTPLILRTFTGDTNTQFGAPLAPISDITSDGRREVVILARVVDLINGDPCGDVRWGVATVYNPSTGAKIRENGGMTPWGSPLANVGDLNKDGYEDYAVGKSGATGLVQVLSGHPAATLTPLVTINIADPIGISSLGDVNGDSYLDFVVAQLGTVRIYSGYDYQVLRTFTGSSSEEFGRSIASLGDANGDGISDLAILTGGSALGRGRIDIFSGATGALIQKIPGDEVHLSSGVLAPLGLIDDDAKPDFLVVNYDAGYILLSNTPNETDPFNSTSFRIISKASGTPTTVITEF